MNEILLWMEKSALGQLMRDSIWLFPFAEILHFLGLCLLIGSLMVVDLRLLGIIKDMSFKAIYRYLPVTILGFAINLVTGTLFLFTDPFRYYPNIGFRIKMALILLAGLNALWFQFKVHPATLKAPQNSGPDLSTRIVAVLSLLLWFAVIVMGRMIPYLEE